MRVASWSRHFYADPRSAELPATYARVGLNAVLYLVKRGLPASASEELSAMLKSVGITVFSIRILLVAMFDENDIGKLAEGGDGTAAR